MLQVTLQKRQLAEKDVRLQSKSKEVAEKDREIASLKARLARIRDVANVESDEVCSVRWHSC